MNMRDIKRAGCVANSFLIVESFMYEEQFQLLMNRNVDLTNASGVIVVEEKIIKE